MTKSRSKYDVVHTYFIIVNNSNAKFVFNMLRKHSSKFLYILHKTEKSSTAAHMRKEYVVLQIRNKQNLSLQCQIKKYANQGKIQIIHDIRQVAKTNERPIIVQIKQKYNRYSQFVKKIRPTPNHQLLINEIVDKLLALSDLE